MHFQDNTDRLTLTVSPSGHGVRFTNDDVKSHIRTLAIALMQLHSNDVLSLQHLGADLYRMVKGLLDPADFRSGSSFPRHGIFVRDMVGAQLFPIQIDDDTVIATDLDAEFLKRRFGFMEEGMPEVAGGPFRFGIRSKGDRGGDVFLTDLTNYGGHRVIVTWEGD